MKQTGTHTERHKNTDLKTGGQAVKQTGTQTEKERHTNTDLKTGKQAVKLTGTLTERDTKSQI